MNEQEVVKNNICKILRYKLDEKKVMSKKQFAQELGVSAAIVSKWLGNINAPDIEYLPKICELLGVSLKEIFMINTEENFTDDEKEVIHKMRNDSFINYVIRRVVFGEDSPKTPSN